MCYLHTQNYHIGQTDLLYQTDAMRTEGFGYHYAPFCLYDIIFLSTFAVSQLNNSPTVLERLNGL